MRNILAGLAVVSLSVAAAAQVPNLAGTWVVDQALTSAATRQRVEATGATGGAVVGGGGGRGGVANGPAVNTDTVITLDGSAFVVDVAGRKTRYALDGTETVILNGRSKAALQGSRVVITTERDFAGRTVSSTMTWYLDGDVLIRESSASKTFYRRK